MPLGINPGFRALTQQTIGMQIMIAQGHNKIMETYKGNETANETKNP